MRIYEVKNASGQTVNFARSFDQARAVVRENNPAAKKIHSNAEMTEFSSCFCIYGIDIKPDKEGILSKLNSLLVEMGDRSPAEPEELEEEEPQPVIETEEVVNAGQTSYPGIIPATEYRVDDLSFPKKGKGRCLHCNKIVGYAGGFPCVDPPDVICD